MEFTKLGRTDIEVSRLCIGCWQAAGGASSDDKKFMDAIQYALDKGLNFLDTAEGYGKGHSEELVGKVIKGRRDKVIISTKFGPHYSHPEKLREILEQSLQRLGTDYIDVYQQHWPPPDVPLTDTIGELERLKEEGKIRAIGVSNWMEPEWEEFDNPSRIDSLQPCYSLLWRSIESKVLPICKEHNIAVIPYSPLCQALLSGKFKNISDLSDNSKMPGPRKHNQVFEPNKFEKALKVVDTLEQIAKKYEKTIAQTALRWLLDQDGITALIVGASRHEQVDENIAAMDWHLEEEDWKKLADKSWPLSSNLQPYDTLWNWHPRK